MIREFYVRNRRCRGLEHSPDLDSQLKNRRIELLVHQEVHNSVSSLWVHPELYLSSERLRMESTGTFGIYRRSFAQRTTFHWPHVHVRDLEEIKIRDLRRVFGCGFRCDVGRIVGYVTGVTAGATAEKTSKARIFNLFQVPYTGRLPYRRSDVST